MRCSSKHICCSTHLTPQPPATHNPPSTFNTKKKKKATHGLHQAKPKPTANKTHTHGEQTHNKPTASKRRAKYMQTMSKPKTTSPDHNHQNTRPTHRNPDRKPKITNPTTTKIGQPPPLKPKSQPTNQNLNPPTKILTHYTQIPKPTIDPQPLQSTAKKSRERVQERIKKKEE